METEKLTTETE